MFSKEKMDINKRKQHLLNEYKKSLKQNIMTSRFNNLTYNENKAYREKNPHIGCAYCTPYPITLDIPQDNILYILEMNNDINKIMGIGMIINKNSKYAKSVYTHGNYNRNIYIGKYRIDRSELTEQEEVIMKAFDILCFKTNNHMKRGQGILQFPVKSLYRIKKQVIDLVDFVNNMFKNRIQNEKRI